MEFLKSNKEFVLVIFVTLLNAGFLLPHLISARDTFKVILGFVVFLSNVLWAFNFYCKRILQDEKKSE